MIPKSYSAMSYMGNIGKFVMIPEEIDVSGRMDDCPGAERHRSAFQLDSIG
jgi:hypothetical protein